MASEYQRKNIELAEEWKEVPAHPEGAHLGYEREDWDCMTVGDGDNGDSFVFTPDDAENEDQYVSAKITDIERLSAWR